MSAGPLKFLVIIGFCLITASASAQEISVRGRFLEDSISIGAPVSFSLTVRYPSERNLYLPDSLFSFPGFEYYSRWYATTVSGNGVSTDSAVYRLTSFSIDSLQFLALPAFEITGTDTTYFQSGTDSVFLRRFVDALPDTLTATNLPVRTFTDYEEVWLALNAKKLMWISGIALAAIVLIWVLFGKNLVRAFRQYQLTKKFRRFQDAFARHLAELSESYQPAQVSALLWQWKEFHQVLESIPYTSLTSKEICRLDDHQELEPALKKIDRMVYSRQASWETQAFEELKAFSEDRFYRMLDMIKQGKA